MSQSVQNKHSPFLPSTGRLFVAKEKIGQVLSTTQTLAENVQRVEALIKQDADKAREDIKYQYLQQVHQERAQKQKQERKNKAKQLQRAAEKESTLAIMRQQQQVAQQKQEQQQQIDEARESLRLSEVEAVREEIVEYERGIRLAMRLHREVQALAETLNHTHNLQQEAKLQKIERRRLFLEKRARQHNLKPV